MLHYGQSGLAVAQAAQLQDSELYTTMLELVLNIFVVLTKPSYFGVRRGEHAIPYEAFIAAVARVKQKRSARRTDTAEFDTFVQEHGSKSCRVSLSGTKAL